MTCEVILNVGALRESNWASIRSGNVQEKNYVDHTKEMLYELIPIMKREKKFP